MKTLNTQLLPILIALITLVLPNLNAQEVSDKKHSLHLEAAGRGLIFGSFNYEYEIKNNFSLGLGLGIGFINNGDITRNNNGTPEAGRFLDIGTTQMIYGNYLIGKSKHKLRLTAGITNFLFTNKNTYPNETEKSVDSDIDWNAGVGYQLTGKKSFFRVTMYFLSTPGKNEFFPDVLPWPGISYGIRL